MRVLSVPCLADNFAYLVIEGSYVACVDPSGHSPIIAAVTNEQISLSAIWLTHHHWDHVGGVDGLLEKYPGIPVVAHKSDASRVRSANVLVDEGDTVELGPLRAKILHNPGHTLGAISYFVEGAVFTGDTMFGAGCGRIFEGTPEMMHASLHKIAALPEDTKVYFGHEYTAANLKFAAHVEPDNEAIKARMSAIPSPSTPSTIALERATNPFLLAKDVSEFAARRELKNSFR